MNVYDSLFKGLMCHLLSVNVRGLRNKPKGSTFVFFRWCKHQKADVIFIQNHTGHQTSRRLLNMKGKERYFPPWEQSLQRNFNLAKRKN